MPITLQEGEQRQLDVQLTPIPPEPATLSGYVTDAMIAAPIAGALVQLSGDYEYSATTNSEGYYQILDIVPGVYGGLVSAAGYETFAF